MAIGLVLSLVLLLGVLAIAIAWTIRLANTVPAVQDIMPILPGEQFFLVFEQKNKKSL